LQAYDDQAADLVVAGTEDGFTVVFNANFDASHMDGCALLPLRVVHEAC
jgi:hypothetical protein